MRHRHPRPDAGFTLVEVMIAVSTLSVVVLGMALTTTAFVRTVNDNRMRNEANAIADTWIGRIRTEPMYDSLAVRYAGAVVIVAAPYSFTRTTVVANDVTVSGVADSLNNYKRVTVTVTAAGLTPPAARTMTIAAP